MFNRFKLPDKDIKEIAEYGGGNRLIRSHWNIDYYREAFYTAIGQRDRLRAQSETVIQTLNYIISHHDEVDVPRLLTEIVNGIESTFKIEE